MGRGVDISESKGLEAYMNATWESSGDKRYKHRRVGLK